MNYKVYRLSSFTETVDGGNPAGVVLNADDLEETAMLEIANKVEYSETAFVFQSEAADYKVRFFTPTEEVDLCGHATIATFNLLRDLNILPCGTYTQETKAGLLSIIINETDLLMEQNKPEFGGIISLDEIKPCFEAPNLTNVNLYPQI